MHLFITNFSVALPMGSQNSGSSLKGTSFH
jgi:hypothetical protein